MKKNVQFVVKKVALIVEGVVVDVKNCNREEL